MIPPSIMCNSRVFDASFLTLKQVSILIVANFILMAANIFVNALVIHILIKKKQISQITYKLIFVLSASDILIGKLPQSLITAVLQHLVHLMKHLHSSQHFYRILPIIQLQCLALIAILKSNMQILEPRGTQRL